MQFQLKHLFGLMTTAAIAAALAAARGAGTLVASAGFLVAWLNLCGACQPIEKSRWRFAILWLAWGLFLLALALPSVVIFGPVRGWAVAWLSITAPLHELSSARPLNPALLFYFACDAANVCALLLPVLIWRLQVNLEDRWGRLLSAALAVSMVAPWFGCWDTPMLAGYYVWCGSFLVALTAIRVGWRTFAGIVGMALVMGWCVWRG